MMGERYTKRDEFRNADIIKAPMNEWSGDLDYEQLVAITEALNQFANYEDLGTPSEIAAKLQELAELQRQVEGRCIMPEGFVCLMLSDDKTLAVWYPEGKYVIAEKQKQLVPSERERRCE